MSNAQQIIANQHAYGGTKDLMHRTLPNSQRAYLGYIPRARGGPIDFGQSGTFNAAPGDWNSFNEATAQMHKEASRPFGGPKKPKVAFIPLAKGGAMRFGRKPYLVGEKGEEFIFPRKDGSGFVIPADVTAQIKPALTGKPTKSPFNRLSRKRHKEKY